MKTSTKILLLLLMQTCFIGKSLHAQNIFPSSGSAGIGNTTPNASSALEIKSITQGLLISRMTKVQRDAIVTPATGLMIYQTNNTPGFYYYSGTAWTALTPKAKAWSLTGNAATNPATDFIGTTDAQPLKFRVSNQKAGLLDYNVLTANTGFGFQSLNSNNGYYNSAFGYSSLFSNTSGIANQANGAFALYANTTGSYNVANGHKALNSNTSGYANTATGFQTLFSNTGGILNTGTGSEALLSNTTGSYNTATGYQSLFSNTTGADNTATGLDAMHYNTVGYSNTANGLNALYSNTTGNYNTALGIYADVSTGNLTNATAIGSFAIVDAGNKVRVGDDNVTSIGGHVGWTTFSDGRYKKNIKEDVKGLAFINSLKPITYTVDINGLNTYFDKNRKHDDAYEKMKKDMQSSADEASKIVYNGFIAQEVEAAAKKLDYDFSGVDKPQNKNGLYGLRYSDFVVPLVKAVQELSAKNDDLQKQIDELKAIILSGNQDITSAQSSKVISINNSLLEQNIPNPFNNSTVVNYTLPANFSSAQLIVTDKSGRVIKQVNVSGAVKGSLQIDASALSSGAYQYSLLIDGKIISTKQMVIAK